MIIQDDVLYRYRPQIWYRPMSPVAKYPSEALRVVGVARVARVVRVAMAAKKVTRVAIGGLGSRSG
jgi:uncharacterized protein YjeT (DUF2065 family)